VASIETLDGVNTGRYVVTTAHGTRHVIDLDAHTATRYAAPGHEWGPRSHLKDVDPELAAIRTDEVTPDGAPFRIVVLRDATVGKRMFLWNQDEWRLTSVVQSIEPAQRRRQCQA
jgi:hypothetical protein